MYNIIYLYGMVEFSFLLFFDLGGLFMRANFQIRERITNKIAYKWDFAGKSRKQVRVFLEGVSRILNPKWFYAVIIKRK